MKTTIPQKGSPVARPTPERTAQSERHLTPAQEFALAGSMEWMRRGWALGVRHVDRDELYDEVTGTLGP